GVCRPAGVSHDRRRTHARCLSDRSRYHRAMSGSLARVGREATAILQQGLLIARAFIRGDAPARLEDGPRAVVFVHGFMALGPVFGPMRQAVVTATGLPALEFSY